LRHLDARALALAAKPLADMTTAEKEAFAEASLYLMKYSAELPEMLFKSSVAWAAIPEAEAVFKALGAATVLKLSGRAALNAKVEFDIDPEAFVDDAARIYIRWKQRLS